MPAAYHISQALHAWLYRWRKPEAELDPDGSTRILRYSRAFRAMWWCFACFPACLLAMCLVVVLDPQQNTTPKESALLCTVPVLFLLAVAYGLVRVYRQNVRFDDEGFTLGRIVFGPVWVAWADVRSVSVSGADEQYLVIGKERGSAKSSLHMNGLGRFALYLERYAPVVLSHDVREMLPRLESSPDQTLSTPAG